jgi:hypothetical protein
MKNAALLSIMGNMDISKCGLNERLAMKAYLIAIMFETCVQINGAELHCY